MESLNQSRPKGREKSFYLTKNLPHFKNNVIMKMKLHVGIATAGVAVVLLSGCVSSKKYKSSQAALSQMRNDSIQLAQQVASLNQNVQSLQDKNNALQRSLDASTSSYATSQKNLGYYQDYFKQQQSNVSQMSDQLKGALSQAGVTNGDIQQVNNTIYVRLDENTLFKKNSTAVTTSGKQALNSLADVIKKQNDINVFVNDGDSSSGTMAMSSSSGTGNGTASDNASGTTMSDNSTATAAPKHHHTHHAAHKSTMGTDEKSTAAASTSSGSTGAAAESNTNGSTAVVHHKHHHKYSSESSSTTYYSNMGKSSGNKMWMLKQHRMGIVANSFLQNGIPKVNITMKQPDMNGNQSNTIAVVIVPKMSDFNPQSSGTAADNK
jgi:outer membrane protein OmpA-like peptidoglycan-associated protein